MFSSGIITVINVVSTLGQDSESNYITQKIRECHKKVLKKAQRVRYSMKKKKNTSHKIYNFREARKQNENERKKFLVKIYIRTCQKEKRKRKKEKKKKGASFSQNLSRQFLVSVYSVQRHHKLKRRRLAGEQLVHLG